MDYTTRYLDYIYKKIYIADILAPLARKEVSPWLAYWAPEGVRRYA